MKAYPIQIRERVIALWDSGTPLSELSLQFGISQKTIRRYLTQRSVTGTLAPRPMGNQQASLGPAERDVLERLRKEDPGATREQLAERLAEQTGIRVTVATIGYWLGKLGFRYLRLERSSRQPQTGKHSKIKRAYGEVGAGASGYPISSPRRAYPSDLTDAQWVILEPLIPKCKAGGRPEEISRRELVNAMLYVLRNGCAWRALPHDFPGWSTVHYYFRMWRMSGLWQEVEDALRVKVRQRAGREPTPSAAAMDSQSVSTTEKGGHVVSTAGGT